jgi:hypothetical protein
MVESVRVSRIFALVMLASCLAVGCGGDDDDDDDGAGKGGGSVAGKGGSGAGAGGAGSGGSKTFDAGQADDRNDVTAGKICERLATIMCAGEAACCDSPGRDFAACKTDALKDCTGQFMLDAIAMKAKVGFDPAGASTAFDMLETRAKACDPSVAAWAASLDGFGMALNGSLAAGADCEPEGGEAAATQADVLTALASCSTSANLACLADGTSWKCTARASKGGKCTLDPNCTDGLYCENPTGDNGAGTCADRKAGGTSCTSDSECTSFICTSGKCAANNDVQAAYCLE